MQDWASHVQKSLAEGQAICRILVAEAKGSSPREAGASMYVTAGGSEGTIGGGALEFEAMMLARLMLEKLPNNKTGFSRHFRAFALGPNLGQCCGGQVSLMFEGFAPHCMPDLEALTAQPVTGYIHRADSTDICRPAEAVISSPAFDRQSQTLLMPAPSPLVPLYLYGAGHVGRAVMTAVSGLSLNKLWVDIDASRFPAFPAPDITIVPAPDMSIIAAHAPPTAIHIVMSYSHKLDEEIVYNILKKNEFYKLGLIGSRTKYQRFCSALKKRGIADTSLEKLICPIGWSGLHSKAPAHVGLSIAVQIASWLEADTALR